MLSDVVIILWYPISVSSVFISVFVSRVSAMAQWLCINTNWICILSSVILECITPYLSAHYMDAWPSLDDLFSHPQPFPSDAQVALLSLLGSLLTGLVILKDALPLRLTCSQAESDSIFLIPECCPLPQTHTFMHIHTCKHVHRLSPWALVPFSWGKSTLIAMWTLYHEASFPNDFFDKFYPNLEKKLLICYFLGYASQRYFYLITSNIKF